MLRGASTDERGQVVAHDAADVRRTEAAFTPQT